MTKLQRLFPPAAIVLTLLAVVAASSLVGAVRGPGLWFAAVLGALVALGAHVLANRLRLLTLEWLALSLGLLLLVGAVAVGPVPTPGAYGDFLRGLIGGWADLLSSVPPVRATGEVLALPYALTWLSSTVGFGLMRHVRVAIVAAIGPGLAFGIGLLFSVELRTLALIQGSILVALSLALGWFQQRQLGFEVDEEIGNTTVARRRARVLYAGAVLAVTAALAPLIAPLAPGLDGRERFDLRDQLEPPWDPLDEPSPLAQIKSNYVDEVETDVAFIVRGDSIPARWALATHASFDGTVWTVGDSDIEGLAPFVPIDARVPEEITPPAEQRALQELEVEVVELDGPWLPLHGRAEEIRLVTDGGVRFNERTGTAADPAGANGATYSVAARPWAILDEDALSDLTFVAGGDLGLRRQASAVRDWSADIVEGADFGWAQVEKIRDALSVGGYLADENAQPGHSWARLTKFFEREDLVGNEEQYAAVAGIAARNAGLNARVVVGYVIDPLKLGQTEVSVTRTEATAWIEVLTEERGWVPIDVTPDRDNEPSLEDSGTRTESVAAPNPPPSIPPPPDLEVAPDEDLDDETKEPEEVEEPGGIPTYVLAGVLAVASPIALMGAWLGVVVGLKALRRRNRRRAANPSHRVAGAWYEATDRMSEFGVAAPRNASLHDFANHAESSVGAAVGLRELADLTDMSAFAADGSSDEIASAAWERTDAIVSRVRRSRGRFERLRVTADPKSLFRRDPR